MIKIRQTARNNQLYLLSPKIDRLNQITFAIAVVATYLAAPVFYIGMVQAVLCSQLGGNASVSNLPVTVSALAGVVPLFASWFVPYRRERSVVVWCALLSAGVLGMTGWVLVTSGSNPIRIVAVVGSSVLTNLLLCVEQVYLYQCLSRGTTTLGRARALKIGYTFGPLAAVGGSLIVQKLLDGSWFHLKFPGDFAAIYFLSVPCALLIAVAGAKQRVVDVPEQPKPRLPSYLVQSFRTTAKSRTLTLLCLAYTVCCAAIACEPNLTLYLRTAVGEAPELLVGYVMAARFSGKSIGGFLLGLTAQKWNNKTVLIIIELLILLGCGWALFVGGTSYVFCFGLLGIGELSGVYFPSYCLSVSPVEFGARNLAILGIFASIGGAGAALLGAIADTWGYPPSIVAATILAMITFLVVRRLPDD